MVPADADRDVAHRELSEYIARVLLECSDWSLDSLDHPVLRIEARLEGTRRGETAGQRQPSSASVFSRVVDLSPAVALAAKTSGPSLNTRRRSGAPADDDDLPKDACVMTESAVASDDQRGEPAGVVSGKPSPEAHIVENDDGDENGDEHSDTGSERRRKGTGGLRLARSDSTNIEETDSQRQIHSGDKFPKRRKVKPGGHFLQPSTLDKLIGGIWEQIHGSLSLDPQSLIQQLQLRGGEPGIGGLIMAPPASSALQQIMSPLSPGIENRHASLTVPEMDDAFSRSNIFCRQVTQASRACRSLEVIVQARWVEYFDAYVDSWAQANPNVPRSRYNKAAHMGACADFGWTEKELRNKMYVWRGYKEIKDSGGWAALVFAGMGIYRFCKYRIGFDRESMQRLKNLRPAMEVAADTLHPQWRQLLTVLGEPAERHFKGHPHDWVVQLDGGDPIPLRNTYLQWDPHFTFQHLDESVVDERAWGCDDPRWSAPAMKTTAGGGGGGGGEVARFSSSLLALCETCGKQQSDDPKLNGCHCFPTLFGSAVTAPSPVLVFRTPDGKNNGLLALCAFERGAPIGEFVGLVTKGYREVDVMESTTTPSSSSPSSSSFPGTPSYPGGGGGEAGGGGTSYQIWQGRQGNFTRFVNHSCKANSQYQRFTWLNTQHIILVSKGIAAGTEVTVDYSEKYWKGLDKKCLCGESCCRYKQGTGRIIGGST